MEFSLVKNDIVIQRIVATQQVAQQIADNIGAELVDDAAAQVGSIRIGGVFVAPVLSPSPEPEKTFILMEELTLAEMDAFIDSMPLTAARKTELKALNNA